jgi:hypothetical protein
MEKATQGVLLELQDGAFPLVTSECILSANEPFSVCYFVTLISSVLFCCVANGDIVATSDYKVAFDNVDCMLSRCLDSLTHSLCLLSII